MLLSRKSLSKIYHHNNSVPSKQPLSLNLHSSYLSFTRVDISRFTKEYSHIKNMDMNITGVGRYFLIFSVLVRLREQCSVAPSAASVVLTLTHPVSPLSPPLTWAALDCCTATHWTPLTPHHPYHRASSRQAK